MTQPAIAPEKTEKKKDVTKLMLKEDKSNILVVMVNSQYIENSNKEHSRPRHLQGNSANTGLVGQA